MAGWRERYTYRLIIGGKGDGGKLGPGWVFVWREKEGGITKDINNP